MLTKNKKIFVLFLGVFAVLSGAFYAGYKAGETEITEGATVHIIANPNDPIPLNADVSLLWDAIRIIKDRYVHGDGLDDKELLYGAIGGVMNSLGDSYSTFMSPSDAKKFQEDLNGNFGGIGAEIGIRDGQLVIVAPLKGNPAESAGLKAGDKILSVDSTSTNNISVEGAVKIIRGDPGTKVKLLIMRDGWNEAKEFEITRSVISIPTMEWEMKEGQIAYVRLYNFNISAMSLLYQIASQIIQNNARGIVLDLRNNPGGYLDVANEIAGWFLKRGSIIVKEQFRDPDNINEFRANGNQALLYFPLVVLVNNGSASASEILAGALRDNREVELIGEKTFGKGSVQEMANLRDGSVAKITIAEWLTPNGSSIEKKGLTPDIEVKITEEDAKNGIDPQLEKAIEVLKNKIK